MPDVHGSDVDVVEAYLTLGLRLGRFDDAIVDAYYGPAALRDTVAAESRREPGALLDDASTLLRRIDRGEGESVEGQRRRWLQSQIRGLHMVCRVLAGEAVGRRRHRPPRSTAC